MTFKQFFLYFLPLLMVATSCREDELVVPTEYDIIGDERPGSDIRGFYLVNEGNMGSNKCTLDFYDYYTGLYSRNFYAERNPNVIKELLLSGKKRQNHIFSTNIISYTCFTKKGLSFEAM